MALISLIAAVDKQFGLGKNNQLLCHLPADLKHFKHLTWGKPIIMGHTTYTAIGKPLPGRRNIVLSRKGLTVPAVDGVEVISSLEEALLATALDVEVMIIGGSQVYQAALPHAARIYLTQIEHQFEADVFFPAIDEQLWRCVSKVCREPDEQNPYRLCFLEYVSTC